MDRMEEYIRGQKSISHSPYLESRILARIEKEKMLQSVDSKRNMPLWQALLLATCLVLLVALGITVGSQYKLPLNSALPGLMVNDHYIENLALYEDVEY
jgi:hypothetical protein